MNILITNLNKYKLHKILDNLYFDNNIKLNIYHDFINNNDFLNTMYINFIKINIINDKIIEITKKYEINVILTNVLLDYKIIEQIKDKCEFIICNRKNLIICEKIINCYKDYIQNKTENSLIYITKSNLNEYLEFKNLPLLFNKTNKIKNAFDIDLFFFCNVNNIDYKKNNYDNYKLLEYFCEIELDGLIYHPKQLSNIFGNNIEIYSKNNDLYILFQNKCFTAKDFVRVFIYESSFDNLSQLLLKKDYDNIINSYQTIFLVFIGNKEIGLDLLNRIIDYKKNINNEFNIAFCIHKNITNDCIEIKKIIKNNFEFYAIYYSNEMGTDITPTLLMYNDILKKYHNLKHVFKFHTKSIKNIYNDLTNYLLTNTIEKILMDEISNCNCIGNSDFYIPLSNDPFNNILKKKYEKIINKDYKFIGGTIFYTKSIVFEKVIKFIKENNFNSYILNNLYENNSINKDFSPIHFLERLFGVIKN